MKAIIIILFINIFLASTKLNANESFMKNSSEALNYVFSPIDNDSFIGISLQLEDYFNKFIFNLKLNIFEGIGDARNNTIFSLMPGLGYTLVGNTNSIHKINLKLSAGLTSLRQNDFMGSGFGSETSLEYKYKNFALDLAYLNLNSNLNEYIKIGFRYYN